VTLSNSLFCHLLYDHLHCTNRQFRHVVRKDMSAVSRRSRRTPLRKNVINEISRKGNVNHTT